MYIRIALLLSLSFCCVAALRATECRAEKIRAVQEPIVTGIGKPFDVRIGQEVVLKSEEVKVKLDSIVRDDRCPVEEQCIWEGDAEVRITISKINQEAKTIHLHTSHRFATEGTYLSYKIKLVKLSPEKCEKYPSDDYMATLTFTK